MGERVIFLDMDGVLCTLRSHWAYSTRSFWMHLDPVGVRMLQHLCAQTSAKLVLSSTWRLHYSRDAMSSILMQAGFAETPPWHDDWKTPQKIRMGECRGYEIKSWLLSNQVTDYLILDDDSDMLEEQMPRFVKTNEFNGFLWEHYEAALKVFGVPLTIKKKANLSRGATDA